MRGFWGLRGGAETGEFHGASQTRRLRTHGAVGSPVPSRWQTFLVSRPRRVVFWLCVRPRVRPWVSVCVYVCTAQQHTVSRCLWRPSEDAKQKNNTKPSGRVFGTGFSLRRRRTKRPPAPRATIDRAAFGERFQRTHTHTLARTHTRAAR